jgi:hypothetical protein
MFELENNPYLIKYILMKGRERGIEYLSQKYDFFNKARLEMKIET